MKFYRFQPINKLTLQNLNSQKNWVADPYDFNDPFEFSLYDNVIEEGNGLRNLNQLERTNLKKLKETIDEFGVICYSAEPVNNLLWAHYADFHKGMCLVFDVSKDKEKNLHKVKYQIGFPKINLTDDVNNYEEIKTIVTTKSIEWSYENEYRQVFIEKKFLEKYPGELVEIIFGCRTPLQDIKTVADIAVNKNQKIIISKMHLDSYQYGLVKSSTGNNREIPKVWGISGIRI